MIKQYRKKPVVIEAVNFYRNFDEVMDFCGNKIGDAFLYEDENDTSFVSDFYLETLEGNMLASEGDYIIKGIKGEFYPCKPDIFEASYEEVK